MSLSAVEIRLLTYALRSPETVMAAVERLRGCYEDAAIEGLTELIVQPPSARVATAAIAALEGCEHPLVLAALAFALRSEHVTVRLIALQALHQRRADQVDDAVYLRLQYDEAWLVRRAALRLLADWAEPICWRILDASDDPHWRVRHALIQILLARSDELRLRCEVEERLLAKQTASRDARCAGVLSYLRYRWTGKATEVPAPVFDFPFAHLWDWDVAVLQRHFERLCEAGRRQAIAAMPILLGHSDERIRTIAVDSLRTHGRAQEFAESIRLLDDLRIGAGESVRKLLDLQHLDQKESLARWIFALPAPSDAQRRWALAQVGKAVPVDEVPPHVLTWRTTVESDPSVHPMPPLPSLARAAAMTEARAVELANDPNQETSWLVLAEAARLARVPFWKLEPIEPWQPPRSTQEPPPDSILQRPAPPLPRPLGPIPFVVCPLGISGHYGLPVEGFVRAYEAGVNLMFWEPNYQTMTAFYRRLSRNDAASIYLMAGTFAADGERIRRDVERALRVLKIERIALFMVFWVQSWHRIAPDVRAVLVRLRDEGKIAAFGLSTHNRVLAVEAMQTGWDPVMVRHSVAHRGAEEHIFPQAVQSDTSIITFNNTCYARLLQSLRDMQPPSAADCYRYTLSMPAVRACLSAPATLDHLEENLRVLREPDLPEERRREMLRFGEALYQEETTFRNLVRAL